MTKTRNDWRRADAMSEDDVHAAALADPDARPLTPERLKRMKRTPQVKVIRRALGLSRRNSRRGFIFRSARCAIGNRDARSGSGRARLP